MLNDATMIDAEEVRLGECADEVYDTGAPAIGVNLEKMLYLQLDTVEQISS